MVISETAEYPGCLPLPSVKFQVPQYLLTISAMLKYFYWLGPAWYPLKGQSTSIGKGKRKSGEKTRCQGTKADFGLASFSLAFDPRAAGWAGGWMEQFVGPRVVITCFYRLPGSLHPWGTDLSQAIFPRRKSVWATFPSCISGLEMPCFPESFIVGIQILS